MSRHFLRSFIVFVVCLALMISASSVVLASSPAITLSVTAGPPTTSVNVSGTSFGKSESVTIKFDTTVAGTTTTDSSGAFSKSITVPSSALPGNHTVQAKGQTSGLSASATFLVRTNWTMFGFDPAHSHVNPYENVLSPSNVSGLVKRWSKSFGFVFKSPPTVVNSIVYIAASNKTMYAFNASTGAKLWSFTAGDNVTGAAVANGIVYFGSDDHKLYACNATTGVKVWTFNTNDIIGTIETPPTIANGLVYFASFNGKVYALNATTGAKVWTTTPSFDDGFSSSSPAVANGMLYIGGIQNRMYALNATTGTKIWTYTVSTQACCLDFSPAVANGMVYFGADTSTSTTKLFALNATTGAKVWTFKLGSFVGGSPAVANAIVYIGSYDTKIYALNAKTGVLIWAGITGGAVGTPTVANGVVYFGSFTQVIYAVNATTGTLLWSFTTAGRISDGPTVADGVVYVDTFYPAGYLYAFHLPGMAP